MLTLKEKRMICLKHKSWIDESGNVFYFGDDSEKSKRIGKIYYRERTSYYHAEDVLKSKLYEGEKDFENVLLKLLKGMNII